MATTPKGIYYPNNYNEIADIPEDLKKMAESIEEVFEDTDSDLSDIKEEQTTQNNRLNSLEVDNTTNKSDILTNKQEINNIKTEQTTQNNRLNNLETDNTTNKDNISANTQEINNIKQEQTTQNTNISTNATNIESLQEENDNLKKIVSQLPQVTGQGTSITLENTIEAQFTIFDEEGNSTQETTTGKNLLNFDSFSSTLKDSLSTLRLVVSLGEQAQTVYTNNSQPIGKISFSFTPNSDYSKFVIKHNGSSQDIRANINFNFVSGTTYYMTLNITGNNPSVVGGFSFDKVMISTVEGDYEPYTGGIASPNPNYEQPIYSAGDNENLLPNNIVTQTKNGVTLTKNTDGTLILNGTSTEGFVLAIGEVTIQKSGDYTLSGCPSGGSLQSYFIYNMAGAPDITDTGNGKTRALNKNDYLNMYLNIRANQTFNNLVFKPKLEQGNKASGFSPYGMGSITEKIANKNLCAFTSNKLITTGHANINYNQNEESYVKIISTTAIDTNTTGLFRMLDLKNFAGKKLYIKARSRVVGTTNAFFFIRQAKFDYSVYSNMITSGNFTSEKLIEYQVANTITEDNRYLFLMMYGRRETTGAIGDYIEYWLSIATENVDYVPHQEQDYSIFVQQPFRSNKDKTIRDKFVVKSDGKLYERHYVLRKIFDGTENWVYSYNNFVLARQSVNTHLANSECLSNSYIYSSTALSGDYGIRTGNADFIQIRDTNYDNVTDFKAMLAEKYASGNPVYVDYLLAEPLDLPCTPEQIQQLENLPSTYKDFTIIQSEDETPAYLEVSGIRDINTMFDKVTNAIVSLGGNV